jgi:squalene-hopene/tetraprenyl-beta-curcumene cyclase
MENLMKKMSLLALSVLLSGTVVLAPAALAQVAPANDAAMKNQAPLKQAAKVQAAIDKGLAFLKSKQLPDGGWNVAQEPPGISALVLKAFAQDPKSGPQADFVKKGYDRLFTYQVESGGIYKDMLANYNTAIAISAIAAAKNPEYKAHLDKAVTFLKTLQWSDTYTGEKGETLKDPKYAAHEGGFGYGRKSRPDLSNTQFSIDALHDAGLDPSDPAFKRAIEFLQRTQNRSESNDQKWSGDDGGFTYTPAGGGDSEAGFTTNAAGIKQPRSYGSMTYAGFKSLLYSGVTKDDPRVQAALDWIKSNWTMDENPGMAVEHPDQAQHGLYYYFHAMARAMRAYGEPVITDAKGTKHDWRNELSDKLISLQAADGSWTGDKRWMEDNPVLTTAYSVLALQEVQKALSR